MSYIPLNIKTHYSLLSSLIKIDDLILYAKKNNINTLGLTDDNLYSFKEFYNKCLFNNIKPIIGTLLYIEDTNFFLYAKNYDGYTSLCKIVSLNNISSIKLNEIESNNLICVCSIKEYSKLNEIFECVYIYYKTSEERLNALMHTKNVVYLNEIRMFKESDKKYLKFLYSIKEGKPVDEITNNISNLSFDAEYNKLDEESTENFSNLIDIKLSKYNFDLPKYKEDSEKLFVSLCKKGLSKRLDNRLNSEYVKRLEYEMKVIIEMGYVDYFLIVYDFILYAKKNNILIGPGRGSAAGSLVSYSLGITKIDPIKYNLIFERFLNPERITMPDIDTDIEDDKRDQLIEYVKNKYKKYSVSNIITFGTLLAKQVLRDVGKSLKISIPELDKIVGYIKYKDTLDSMKLNKEFMMLINSKEIYKELFEVSLHLENLKRHISIHAAGIVISSEELYKKVPLVKSGDNILTGYTMEYMEEFGLLKMDFLALKNLSIISNILKNINKDVNLDKIDLNDKNIINMFKNVYTTGIFQFESEGMKSFLKEYEINSFDDLVASIALYRPGPREMIPTYIKRKKGKEKITYIVKELESILSSTYGIIVYQEQIIEILKVIGSFSYAEADNIRRAMSKKKLDVITSVREKFIKGALKNNINENLSNEIFELILKFASYGFNKSHSVAYSMIAFELMYLKTYFKKEFMISLMNNTIGRNEKTKEYIDESILIGLNFENISINTSTDKYELLDNKIILPFKLIKGLGEVSVNFIINERLKGNFTSFYDFMKRCYSQEVNKSVVEALIKIGAFDEFLVNKKQLIKNLDSIIEYTTLVQTISDEFVEKPIFDDIDDFKDNELLSIEYDLLGFYYKSHPVKKYRRDNMITLNNISKYFNKVITVICIIDEIKGIKTKNNENMAFLKISDEFAKTTLVVFPKTYQYGFNYKKSDILKLTARVEKRMSEYQLICVGVEKINA